MSHLPLNVQIASYFFATLKLNSEGQMSTLVFSNFVQSMRRWKRDRGNSTTGGHDDSKNNHASIGGYEGNMTTD